MEEGGGPTVKLTRLRRRLSVEAEDVKSPSTPSTPTKKRGGRLAAKPQLELIDEHVPENVTKRSTRKSIAREIVDVVEDKPVTPSRRSARIRSNTSIVSDTPQNFDSPRAKRAARRLSQAGSDNEGPITPARQTRRTRKDSTSSLDKADAIANNKISPSTEVIAEEVENNVKETKDSDDSCNDTPTRRSPRLKKNNGKKSRSSKPDETDRNVTLNSSINKGEMKPLEVDSKSNELHSTISLPIEVDQADTTVQKIAQEPNLSITSYNLIKELDTKPKKTDHNYINKSLSSVEVINNSNNKRHRTKSWTTITQSSSSDGSFYSDTEISKKKNRIKNKSVCLTNTSGDGILSFNKADNSKTEKFKENTNENSFLNTSKKTNKSVTNIEQTINNVTVSEGPNDSLKSVTETAKNLNHSNESNKENITSSNSQEKQYSETSEKLFEETPSGRIQSLVYIDDSDSNTGSTGKPNIEKVSDEDQCVPIVEHQVVNQEATPSTHNDTCEPMDIDETMPQNISIPDFQNKSLNSKRKSSLNNSPQENKNSANKSNNESIIKSSMSISESQNLETSGNENKSTLILSQIKDLSSNELLSKSPKVTSNEGSNLVKLPDKDDLKTQSQNYSTSTPLQQKLNKKLGLPMNTSIISSQESKDVKEIMDVSRNNNSNGTKAGNSDSDEDSSNSDEDEPKEKSGMFDDEAEEASDDYESGDSQDEDERQYEEENEIKEKGETLDSDEDISNDSDYEKDSFIVSSDEEDNELLSGSGDDLSLSDNELTMSAKSKNKFNKRKEKEQKKASKEMYEARHKINDSDNSSKSKTPKPKKNNRMRLDSALLDSDSEDATVVSRKNCRPRIDSSQDLSIKSEHDESVSRKKKKTKRLSESMYNDSIISEKEITVSNTSILDKNDPLLLQPKQEPKTPQKDLDISTVLITNREEVEKVNVNENDVMFMKINETSDPLHATMVDNDLSSSSSDNAEIIQNYDSMLSDLNNDVKNKRAKLWDTSLNLNKKTKSRSNAPIVDQLNLTLTKKSRKTKVSEDVVDSAAIETQDTRDTTTRSKPIANAEEDSSDSIDMRLLFPEDSNDSESAYNKNKTNKDTDEFIPLKRTEGKTDITECLDTTIEPKQVSILNTSKNKDKKRKSSVCLPEQLELNDDASQPQEESVLNVSKKKDKKRKSSLCQPEEIKFSSEEPEFLGFYVDTTGAVSDTVPSVHTSLQNSAKKKKNKNKNNSMSTTLIEHGADDNANVCDDDDPPLEISYQSAKKIKSKQVLDMSQTTENKTAEISNTDVNTSQHKKKKSKQALDSSQIIVDSLADISAEIANTDLNTSQHKKKKSKQALDSSQIIVDSLADISAEIANTDVNTSQHKKKKSKQALDSSQIIVDSLADISDNVPAVLTSQKDKKKKNKKLSETAQSDIEIQCEENEKSMNCSMTNSEKKKKKKKSSVPKIVENPETVISIDDIQSTQINITEEKSAEIGVDIVSENIIIDDKIVTQYKETSSKKRKRRSSGEPRAVGDVANASQTFNESLTSNNLKKKQKIMADYEEAPTQANDSVDNNVEKVMVAQEDASTKKTKKSKHLTDQGNIMPCAVPVNDIQKKSRKRKERDDDNASKVSKILKENLLDKVHVSRLPASLLNQLDDKPKEVLALKKSSPVSTTQFVVEETKKKKSKPSHYLEESVYLNESHIAVKQKASLKKPKVLPFIPTASTSASGFTTNFRVNQISSETQFIAQSSNIPNFKADFLQNKRIKRFGTYEMYKKRRNIKLSKF